MIVVVDYGLGNLGSISNMFRKIGVSAQPSGDPSRVAAAERFVLPGVGAFDAGMSSLRASGLIPILEERVLRDGAPLLGICLGLQLLTRSSEEGSERGLGWLAARTVRFRFSSEDHRGLKVPHMGWNRVTAERGDAWPSLLGEPRFYFVHSYHVDCDNGSDVMATTTYGYRFPVAIRHGNIVGVQFHPEKSHRYGMAVLRDFAAGA